MQKEFKAIEGQSVIDLCLNTYCSINELPRFLKENNIDNINGVSKTLDSFVYDSTYIADQLISNQIEQNGFLFRTGIDATKYLLVENTDILRPENDQNFLV